MQRHVKESLYLRLSGYYGRKRGCAVLGPGVALEPGSVRFDHLD